MAFLFTAMFLFGMREAIQVQELKGGAQRARACACMRVNSPTLLITHGRPRGQGQEVI